MKRRNFLKKAGASATAAGAFPLLPANKSRREAPTYRYPRATVLDDLRNDEDLIALCIGFSSADTCNTEEWRARISSKRGSIERKRTFGYIRTESPSTFTFSPTNNEQQILTLWIADATDKTTISLKGPGQTISFQLSDLLTAEELTGTIGNLSWHSHFLMYHEIGVIDPVDVGINSPSDDFVFVALADPQGGDPYEGKDRLKTRMRIHNAFIEESVDLIRKLNVNPAFTMVIGDVTDDWGASEDFAKMHGFLKKSGTPLLYGIGNHETALRSVFRPGYDMSAFDNYMAAQKTVNGLDLLLYSFELGQWHFVVWPDPLRPGFWESHPHYLDWLERDLEQNRSRPTIIFQHVPIHPIGIVPLIDYAESVFVKRELLGLFRKHGNVKYVLSGHVHIPIKASFKTAVEMEGIQFINLPAAGYRPRAFGEEDYHGGPSQGIAVIEISGPTAQITAKTVTEEEYAYPPTLRTFPHADYPLWLGEDWELPLNPALVNGDFSEGLSGWYRRFVYTEDVRPANRCETKTIDGQSSLYLFNRKRGYVSPGQDRLPQDINKVFQMVAVDQNDTPTLSLDFLIGEEAQIDDLCGAYVWVSGNSGRTRHFNLIYSINPVWANMGGRQETRGADKIHIELSPSSQQWHQATLNIADDFDRFQSDRRYEDLAIDRLMIKLGVWTANDGTEKPFGIYFRGLDLKKQSSAPSLLDGSPLMEKPMDRRWWRGKYVRNANIAGEHRYMLDTEVRFTDKK